MIKKHTQWSTDVKLFPNSQITATFGLSPHKMVFNQKTTQTNHVHANSSKNAKRHCHPTKDSLLPLHTHEEDHFHYPQNLKLAFIKNTRKFIKRFQRTHYKVNIFNPKQKHASHSPQVLK